jgi:hypothetical protein
MMFQLKALSEITLIYASVALFGLTACVSQPATDSDPDFGKKNLEWGNEEYIEITGIPSNQNAMEPQVSDDELFLFFNNGNGDGQQMDLFYATKVSATQYQYQGPLSGVNHATEVDGTAAIDSNKNFYFVSTRNYGVNQDTVYGGVFNTNGSITNVSEKGQNITDVGVGLVTMGVDITYDGNLLFLSRARFSDFTKPPVEADLDIAYKNNGTFLRDTDASRILKDVNTTQYLEYAAALSKDGLELYFTRGYDMTKPDGLKIMVSKRANTSESFGPAELITAITGNITEAPCLSFDDRRLYFHKNVNGRSRIYRVSR